MGRIRYVKPEFFLDEQLSELHPDAQLLYIGLWTMADRDGRLEDRPKRIKASVFPYRAVDVDKRLEELAQARFVVRYEVDGKACVAIPRFLKHQRPHPKETSFGLPPPPEHPDAVHTQPRNSTASREISRKGAEAIPSSPGGEGNGDRNGDGEGMGDGSAAPTPSPTPPAAAEEKPADLQALWNADAHPELPRWRDMTEARAKAARARLRERPLAQWRQVVQRINASAFCRGGNRDGWSASPDWLLKPDTATKVLEGKYDDRRAAPAPARTPPASARGPQDTDTDWGDVRPAGGAA